MSIRLMFGGDAMLGRGVAEMMQKKGYQYPLGDIAHYFQAADVSIINLECAITSSNQQWQGTEKAFYFGARPEASLALKEAGIQVVSLANNHILDFDYQGLRDTILLLDQQAIKHAGAGENIIQAKSPTIFEVDNIKFAMVAYCDHQSDFLATDKKAGMNYLDLSSTGKAIKQLEKDYEELIDAEIDWPILSLHWGPNMMLSPSKQYIEIAHHAIDMGYKILFGHSAHVFQGVEFYKGFPIIYAAGDLVDDYTIDPYYKNDHGLLFEIELDLKNIKRLICYPIFLEYCHTLDANQAQIDFITERFSKQCEAFSTSVERKNNNRLQLEDKK